jgi:hypothetical protein
LKDANHRYSESSSPALDGAILTRFGGGKRFSAATTP